MCGVETRSVFSVDTNAGTGVDIKVVILLSFVDLVIVVVVISLVVLVLGFDDLTVTVVVDLAVVVAAVVVPYKMTETHAGVSFM